MIKRNRKKTTNVLWGRCIDDELQELRTMQKNEGLIREFKSNDWSQDLTEALLFKYGALPTHIALCINEKNKVSLFGVFDKNDFSANKIFENIDSVHCLNLN